jgi:hypothetical protein
VPTTTTRRAKPEIDMRPAIAALAVLLSSPAAADLITYQNADELLGKCGGETDYSNGMCLGYIIGVSDAVSALEQTGALPKLVCIPRGATIGQVHDVVVKYLSDNPDQHHYTASSTVWTALLKAFPCP